MTQSKKPMGKTQEQGKPEMSQQQIQMIARKVAEIKGIALTLAVQLNQGSGDIKQVLEHFEVFKETLGLKK